MSLLQKRAELMSIFKKKGNTPKTYKIKQFSIAALILNVDHEGELIFHPPDLLISLMQLLHETDKEMYQFNECV